MLSILVGAMIMTSMASPVPDGSIAMGHGQGQKEQPMQLEKTVEDSGQPSVSPSAGFHKMPDCLSSEPYCGGAMYLYYLRWRNLFVDEWPYEPADPTCFRDTLLLDYHSDIDGATMAPTDAPRPDIVTFNLTFNLPYINTSLSDTNTVSLYHATVYVPLIEALRPNTWVEVTTDETATDGDPLARSSSPGVVALADVWPSDGECREHCIHYITANVTSSIEPIWKNQERTIVVVVTLHCEWDEADSSNSSSSPCMDDTIFSDSDVPALLFDYTICGDNSTQNYYINQLLL